MRKEEKILSELAFVKKIYEMAKVTGTKEQQEFNRGRIQVLEWVLEKEV